MKEIKHRKKRIIPRHPDLEALMPSLGPVKGPETFEEELIEFIDSEFMFEGFPGFEDGVIRVANILIKYKVNPKGKEGQKIFKTYIEHALEELYGDFNRWALCGRCGESFNPKYSLAYVNQILEQGILCLKCSGKRRKKEKMTRIVFTGLTLKDWKKELKQLEKSNKKSEIKCYLCKREEDEETITLIKDEENPVSVTKLKVKEHEIDFGDMLISYSLCIECATLFRKALFDDIEEYQNLKLKFEKWARRVKKEMIKEIPEVKSKQIKEFLKENGATEAQIKKCFQYWKKEELIDKRYLK